MTPGGQPTSGPALAAVGAVAQPTAAPTPTAVPEPAPYFSDLRLTYEPGFYAPQIQAFLDGQPGPLKRLSLVVGGRQHSFAEVLVGQTSYYSVNPRVLLALLELQSRLLSTENPGADQLAWAMGYQGEGGKSRGLGAQVRWATRQIILAKRDYPSAAPLTFADRSTAPPPAEMTLAEYALARALAPTTTADKLPTLLRAFQETYTRLFGDPRPYPADWPPPAEPFLWWPLERPAQVTSFFDHGGPFLARNPRDGVVTYWGRREIDIAFAYNGHDGWDYAAAPPALALAAADGDVVFAGNADDNCATRAVILDHGNGYRTLYWHLARVDVAIGQAVRRGEALGVVGESGCAFGPHLHFGVQYLGRNVDPYGWCGGEVPDPWAAHPAGSSSSWLWADRPSPCGEPPAGAVVVDNGGPGFSTDGEGWERAATGYGGDALFVASVSGLAAGVPPGPASPVPTPAATAVPAADTARALYRPTLPATGRYRVLAYVPYALSGLVDAESVRYRVRYRGGEAEITANLQVHANEWIDLGTYEFGPGEAEVVVGNLAGVEQRSVWADAVMWLPAP